MMRDDLHELRNGIVGAWSPAAAQYRTGATGWLLEDLSGRGNHGTLTSMDPATDWVTSGGYGGLYFDGASDYVDIPSIVINTSDRPLGISAFVVQDASDVTEFIFANDQGTGPPLYVDLNNNTMRLFSGGYATASSAYTWTAGLHHYGWFWGSDDTVGYYRDGVLLSQTTKSAAGTTVTPTASIGSSSGLGPLGFGFTGSILEVLIHKKFSPLTIPHLHSLGPGGLFTPRRRRIVAPVTAAAGNRRRRFLISAA